MRPYLAIIRDSFHEAFASRVLWILLVLIVLLLLALSPLGIREDAGSHLSSDDIVDVVGLGRQLSAGGLAPADSAAKRIWSRLDLATQRQLIAPPNDSKNPFETLAFHAEVTAALNLLLDEPDLFDQPEDLGFALSSEGKQLYEQGLAKLPADQLARYNRLVLDRAFSGDITPARPTQLSVKYAVWTLFESLPLTREEFSKGIQQALMVFMVYVLGVIGVMVAIVVTASIIPQTFESGAIDLLLSKPVARSLVFLTKFFGGCAFILINSALLIGGLWLLLGARLGIWNFRMLWCIPLYVFLFAIYYSVSSLAGVIWRNPIVSVILTVLFWGICFALGTSTSLLESLVFHPQRLVKLVPTGTDMLAVNERGQIQRWSSATGDWQDVFKGSAEGAPPMMLLRLGGAVLGPVYDARSGRLLAGDMSMQQFMPGTGSTPLLVGKAANNWQRTPSLSLPPGAEAMFIDAQGALLVVTPRGVSRLEGNPEERPQPMKVFSFELPIDAKDRKFVEVGPVLGLRTSFSASFDQATSAIAVYDGRRLAVLELESPGKYRLRNELAFDPGQAGVVALGGSTLLLALADGQVQLYDPATLKVRRTFEKAAKAAPRFALASPDGRRFAVLYHNGRLWMYDSQQDREMGVPITGQAEVSAVAFAAPDRLLVADRGTRLIEYDLNDWKAGQRREPSQTTMDLIYRLALRPIYTVFPKPAELDNLVLYLLTGETSVAATNRREDLSATRLHIDVWGPVRSNLIFLAVMLGLGCVYVARKDF